MIVQQPLARLFNSHWHDCSTVAGTIVQQSLARFFNSHWHICSTVTGNIFSFFYAGRILQQWNHCWRIVPCTRNTTHDPKMKSKSLAAFSFKEELCFSLICCSLLFLKMIYDNIFELFIQVIKNRSFSMNIVYQFADKLHTIKEVLHIGISRYFSAIPVITSLMINVTIKYKDNDNV